MSSLKERIAEKERAVRANRIQLQAQHQALRQEVHDAVTSPRTLIGGFAVGLALATLRCPRRRHGATFEEGSAPLRSLQWLLRHLGPPVLMTLLHRYSAGADNEELNRFGEMVE